jgi:hypothetical protein
MEEMIRCIPLNQVSFNASSIVDQNGRLFEWQGQLFRAISSKYASFIRDLFLGGTIDQLVNRGFLIETKIAPFVLDGYDLVLEHRRVPFVSYAYEWTPSMLKDAAILLLDLGIELVSRGITMQDAHPWNILFDGSRPVFVDAGSFKPIDDSNAWVPEKEFLRFFLRPLIFFSKAENRLARCFLSDYHGVTETDMDYLRRSVSSSTFSDVLDDLKQISKLTLYNTIRRREILFQTMQMVRNTLSRRKLTENGEQLLTSHRLSELKKKVIAIDFPKQSTTWAEYHMRTSYPNDNSLDEWTKKNRSVLDVLTELRPRTLLDVASNRGWYAQQAAKLGCNVVAFDNDEPSIANLYHTSREQELPILPLVMDIIKPSPGYGWFGRGWALPATDRFKCEMVLALAIIHHLAFRSSIPMGFAHIIELLGVFAKRWLLVEFIPPDDNYLLKWHIESYSWYNRINFLKELEVKFNVIKELPSHPSPRVLFLCERR